MIAVRSNPSVMKTAPLMAEPVVQCQGKALPNDLLTGENVAVRFDDWIPALERAATWNNWTEIKH